MAKLQTLINCNYRFIDARRIDDCPSKQPAFRVDAFRHVIDKDEEDPELSSVGLLMLPEPHLKPCHQPLHAELCHSGKIGSIQVGAHGCHINADCIGVCYAVQR